MSASPLPQLTIEDSISATIASSLVGLNEEQLAAVQTTEGPLLILAGAGTGKTTAVTRRIAHLIETGLAQPNQILALTFTDKAALEMEERVDVLVPMGYVDAWILTFHAFGDRILREHALEMGLSPDFKVMGKTEQILFLQQHLFELGLDYYRPLSNPTKFLEALVSFISRCKDEDITPEEYQRYVESLKEGQDPAVSGQDTEGLDEVFVGRQRELASAYATYERLKTENNVMDFGDQVHKVVQLFKERPDILKKYQEKFRYVLVDEFQDTNFAQNQLVKLLSAQHQNICVVGDDDQSIYKFRGAAISNILQFEKDFPTARRVVLTQNYRSTQAILDASYRLIQHNNPDRLEVANQVDKRLIAPIKTGGVEPEELFAQTLSEEAEAVVAQIESLMQEQPELQYKDFALLVRANSQAEPFTQALAIRGIPVKFSGASGLYERPEIQLLLSWLMAIGTVSESMNLFHVASSEFYQVPMTDLLKIMDWVSEQRKSLHWGLNHFEAADLGISESGLGQLVTLRDELMEYINQSAGTDVGGMLYQFLDRHRYFQHLQEVAATSAGEGGVTAAEAAMRLQNVAQFFDKIQQFYTVSQYRTVRAFLDYIALMREAGDDPVTASLDPEVNAVNILTVHAAKGLEFGVVFMVNLVAERFPSRERSEAIPLPDKLIKEQLPQGDAHLQEERRLFYVGMTRAKDRLFLCWGRDYGGRRERKISPFVLEALGHSSQVAGATKLSAIERIQRSVGQLGLPIDPPAEMDLSGVTLNPHKVDDYESCPLKFYFGNVLHVPTSTNQAMVYGTSVHRAIEEFYKAKQQGKTLSLDQTLDCFGQTWQSKGFLSEEHERLRFEQGQKLLTEFWQREHQNPFAPTILEKDFKLKIDDVVVTGRWDRLDRDSEGKVTILDYKTTSGMDQKKADRKAKESVQLMVYTLAYEQMYGELPTRVGLLFVDGNIFGSYEPSQKTIEEATQHVLSVASGIKAHEFGATPSAMVCEFCPFATICPHVVRS